MSAPSRFDLEARVALTTGGSSGLDPAELAAAAAFLASDASSDVTGIVLPVDGELLTS